MSPLLLCLFIPPSHLPRPLQASCLVEVAGSRLQFVTAIQLRLIVIAADGLEPGPSLGPGRPKHFSLFLSRVFFFLSLSGFQILSFALLILISSSVVPICLLSVPSLSFAALFSKSSVSRVQITGDCSEKAHFVVFKKCWLNVDRGPKQSDKDLLIN